MEETNTVSPQDGQLTTCGEDIPIASQFLTPRQVDEVRQHVSKTYEVSSLQVVWSPNPDLDALLK